MAACRQHCFGAALACWLLAVSGDTCGRKGACKTISANRRLRFSIYACASVCVPIVQARNLEQHLLWTALSVRLAVEHHAVAGPIALSISLNNSCTSWSWQRMVCTLALVRSFYRRGISGRLPRGSRLRVLCRMRTLCACTVTTWVLAASLPSASATVLLLARWKTPPYAVSNTSALPDIILSLTVPTVSRTLARTSHAAYGSVTFTCIFSLLALTPLPSITSKR